MRFALHANAPVRDERVYCARLFFLLEKNRIRRARRRGDLIADEIRSALSRSGFFSGSAEALIAALYVYRKNAWSTPTGRSAPVVALAHTLWNRVAAVDP